MKNKFSKTADLIIKEQDKLNMDDIRNLLRKVLPNKFNQKMLNS